LSSYQLSVFICSLTIVLVFNFFLIIFAVADIRYCSNATNNLIEIISDPNDKSGIVLSSDNYPKKYPNDLRCMIYLIGASNERVELQFIEEFAVIGVPPK